MPVISHSSYTCNSLVDKEIDWTPLHAFTYMDFLFFRMFATFYSFLIWLSAFMKLRVIYIFYMQNKNYNRNIYFSFFVFIFIVQLQLPFFLHYSPLLCHYPIPTNNILLLCSYPQILHICSFTWPFLFILLLFLSPHHSGHCQIVLYFDFSDSILLSCLFSLIGCTYRWDHTVFTFFSLVYFT